MKPYLLRLAALALALVACGPAASAQVSTTGSLTGTVTDPGGAVVAGASVSVKSDATGQEFTATTSDSGTFNIPSLQPGNYTVTIEAGGFKKANVTNVKVDVGQPSSISVALVIGEITDVVTITGAGGELLQTQTATVGQTITGRQITELPFSSRDALDLVTFLPGVQTTGRPRQSSVNGLPKGALNITIDGTNVQDNLIKSQDGFFTNIRPRIDAIEEVSISTATPGAEASGEGAVQIRFSTRSGTNDLTGSLYWYHRNPALNANYWFNNATLAPDPVTGKAPRNRVLLNQYGGRVGGPVSIPGLFDGRDRAFFFVNYEEFRLPEQQLRQRVIFSPEAQSGIFQYDSGGVRRTVNLLDVLRNNGFTGAQATIDPTIGALLGEIRGSAARGGTISPLADPNFQRFSFVGQGNQIRFFPTVRLDWNVTQNHHVENIWNYQDFNNDVDFLNNTDPAFPGFPNFGGQDSIRWSNTTALRSTLTPTLVNEARLGIVGGILLGFPQISASQFANQGGFDLVLSGAGITDASAVQAAPAANQRLFGLQTSRRNTPTKQFTDTLTWVRGTHSLNFGGSFTQIDSYQFAISPVVPTVTFGIAANDPLINLISGDNAALLFPGASSAQLGQAGAILALLTGRVTGVTGPAFLNEEGNSLAFLGDRTQRYRQRVYSLFAQDSWRARPNLTLNYGLRWEPQQAPVSLNRAVSRTSYAALFGESGEGNLFRPGTLTGTTTQFSILEPGDRLFATDSRNFAPSVGFAYSPDWKSGILNRLFGSGEQSVIRGGYSIAYIREGISVLSQIAAANPGANVTASRTVAIGNLAVGSLFRDVRNTFTPDFNPTPTFPTTGALTDAAFGYDPDIKTSYANSFTIGLQRELTKDMVIEARYVGTRAVKLWRRYNLNEVNVLENGFLNEFLLAQANLAANRAAGRGNTFRYFGPGTGTSPLPTILAHFSGVNPTNAGNAALYTSAFFSNAAFVTPLATQNANPQGFANTLVQNPALFRANAAAAGLPANLFVVNPGKIGGASLTDNGGQAWYDALQIDFRRRMAQGLLVQANYVWSKSSTNMFASSQSVLSQPATLRDFSLNKVFSPFDIRHAFKVNWLYELPFGRGRNWLSDADGLTDRLLGGWEFHGTARVQSGRAFNLGNVQLVGMTRDELQDAVEIRKGTNAVFFLPDDIILNTQRAFATSATTASGFAGTPPEGRFIAPAGFGGCVQAHPGGCGFADIVLHGPRFVRVDLSAVKKIRITERTNVELRGEFLNAINNINFFVGGSAAAEPATIAGTYANPLFGQTNQAYQDISTTNDPGGRLVQFVLRINF
jgi:Carboxypeptidase regulatory-like domain